MTLGRSDVAVGTDEGGTMENMTRDGNFEPASSTRSAPKQGPTSCT